MQNNIATFDKNKFTPYSIGFDSLFDKLFEMDDHNSNSYPPYNIFKKDENNYTIEMALAGFNKSNIDLCQNFSIAPQFSIIPDFII